MFLKAKTRRYRANSSYSVDWQINSSANRLKAFHASLRLSMRFEAKHELSQSTRCLYTASYFGAHLSIPIWVRACWCVCGTVLHPAPRAHRNLISPHHARTEPPLSRPPLLRCLQIHRISWPDEERHATRLLSDSRRRTQWRRRRDQRHTWALCVMNGCHRSTGKAIIFRATARIAWKFLNFLPR